MKRNKLFWILGIVLCIAIGGIAYIFLGDSSPTGKAQLNQDEKARLVEFTGADLHEIKDGKYVWRVAAQKILYNTDTNEVELTNVTAFFEKDGNILRINAEKGLVAGDKSTIMLMGTVEGKSETGVTFEGSNLVFDNKQKRLYAKEGFVFTKGDITLTADTLDADMVMEKVRVVGNVRLTKEN